VYLVDHGSRSDTEWYFRINETESVSATEIDDALDALQAALPDLEIALVCDFCYSGGFVTGAHPTIGQQRICISGATDESLAIFSGTFAGVSFSNFFFDCLSGGAHFKMAFDVGRDGILAAYVGPPSQPLQVPWLEDNADGVISDKYDGAMARTFYWGTTAGYGLTPPTLLAVTPQQTLGEGTGQVKLWTEVAGGHNMDRVWVNVVHPDTRYENGEPIVDIEQVELIREGSSQVWSTEYIGFRQRGLCHFIFFAQGYDSDPAFSMISNPLQTLIEVTRMPAQANPGWALYE